MSLEKWLPARSFSVVNGLGKILLGRSDRRTLVYAADGEALAMTLPKAAVIGSAQIKLRPAWSGAQRSDLISAGSGVNCGPNGAMSAYSIIYLQLAARLAPLISMPRSFWTAHGPSLSTPFRVLKRPAPRSCLSPARASARCGARNAAGRSTIFRIELLDK